MRSLVGRQLLRYCRFADKVATQDSRPADEIDEDYLQPGAIME